MKWHLLFQGLVIPILLYFFIFKLRWGMVGVWCSKLIIDISMTICIASVVFTADWYQIATDSAKRQQKDLLSPKNKQKNPKIYIEQV